MAGKYPPVEVEILSNGDLRDHIFKSLSLYLYLTIMMLIFKYGQIYSLSTYFLSFYESCDLLCFSSVG